jgi:hypothetical protein
MTRVTVYLTGPFAPGNRDWHQAYLLRQDQLGITVVENNVGTGEKTTYPWVKVQRVTEHA